MDPNTTTRTPLFTLQYDVIPEHLRPDPNPDGSPAPWAPAPDARVWWVTGLSWVEADDLLPYLAEGNDTGPATRQQAERYFAPIVAITARRLLGLDHGVGVAEWRQVGEQAWEPVLEHRRWTLTIHTVDRGSLAFHNLDEYTVGNVTRAVDEFDVADVDGDEQPMWRAKKTTVSLTIPVEGNERGQRGTLATRDVTFRIASIVGYERELWTDRLTPVQVLKIREAHDSRQSRG